MGNMPDEKLMRMAIARFRGFRSHIHGPITQNVVNEYHSILIELETGTGEFLQDYSIPPTWMAPRVLPYFMVTHHNRKGEPQFSEEKYCEKALFKSTIDALWHRLDCRR